MLNFPYASSQFEYVPFVYPLKQHKSITNFSDDLQTTNKFKHRQNYDDNDILHLWNFFLSVSCVVPSNLRMEIKILSCFFGIINFWKVENLKCFPLLFCWGLQKTFFCLLFVSNMNFILWALNDVRQNFKYLFCGIFFACLNGIDRGGKGWIGCQFLKSYNPFYSFQFVWLFHFNLFQNSFSIVWVEVRGLHVHKKWMIEQVFDECWEFLKQ